MADALQRHDVNAAASALATIAQAVHQAQLHVDPEGLATAALTHRNGEYVGHSAFSGQ